VDHQTTRAAGRLSGVPPIRLHDTRHGAACLAYASGACMKAIKARPAVVMRWRKRRGRTSQRKASWRYGPGGDRYLRQHSPPADEPCRHDYVQPVRSPLLREVVAWRCLECEQELPAGWEVDW
jgi:hypothetical protein